MADNNTNWVLVTGSSGGIGRALVNAFRESAYFVIALDRLACGVQREGVIEVEADLERLVVDEFYASQVYEKVMHHTDQAGLTCLINNAAVQILGDVNGVTRETWHRTMNVNLGAPFFLSHLFLDSLITNRGSIVNISSIHASQTKKDFCLYATSKGALSALTRNMSVAIGRDVRVNCIEPAAISTDMLKAGFEGKEKQLAELHALHPIGRIGAPSEIAELAVFLCSEKAKFVQGACIRATGGIDACLLDPV